MEDKKYDKSIIKREALEILRVNVKHFRNKRKEQAFIEEVKIFQPQTALLLPILLQLQPGQNLLHSKQRARQICTS